METDARAPYHVPLGHCSKDTAHVPVDTSLRIIYSLLSNLTVSPGIFISIIVAQIRNFFISALS